jgi:hypothetical protein
LKDDLDLDISFSKTLKARSFIESIAFLMRGLLKEPLRTLHTAGDEKLFSLANVRQLIPRIAREIRNCLCLVITMFSFQFKVLNNLNIL